MRAIRKNVGDPARIVEGELSYEFWVEVVGGYVQMVPIGPEVEVICHEEGMYAGPNGGPLPQNAAGFLGNILIVAVDSDSGECRDMTDEEIRKGLHYLEVFAAGQHPMHTGGPVTGILVGKEAEKFMQAKTEGTLAVWDAL